MKDPIDIGTDTVNKAARDNRAIALLRSVDGVKKVRASELMPKHEQFLIGVYTSTTTPEQIGEDIRYVFQHNLCK